MHVTETDSFPQQQTVLLYDSDRLLTSRIKQALEKHPVSNYRSVQRWQTLKHTAMIMIRSSSPTRFIAIIMRAFNI